MSTEILDRSKIGLRKVEYTNEMAKKKKNKRTNNEIQNTTPKTKE